MLTHDFYDLFSEKKMLQHLRSDFWIRVKPDPLLSSPLNSQVKSNCLPGFEFKIFVHRIDGKIFWCGENGEDTMLLQLFYDQLFFMDKFFRDRFDI